MATQVFTIKEFVLQDEDGNEGRTVRMTPLPLKHLRKFMEKYNEIKEGMSETEVMEIIFECAIIAVQARNKDIDHDELEETLDLDTAMEIASLAGGLQLGNAPSQVTTPKKA